MRPILGATVAALVLAGCGSVDTGTGGAPTPSSQMLHFDVAVSERNNAATMRVGQRLEVVLHSYTGLGTWAAPMSSDQAILATVPDPAATAVRGVTLGAFQALAPGDATVTSTAAPMCSPGRACPAYAVLYSLKVTVKA